MRGVSVDNEEREFGSNIVSIVRDEARSVPTVFRMCGVPAWPSSGTTVGGVRARKVLISYRVGGSLRRLCIGGWGPSAVEVATPPAERLGPVLSGRATRVPDQADNSRYRADNHGQPHPVAELAA